MMDIVMDMDTVIIMDMIMIIHIPRNLEMTTMMDIVMDVDTVVIMDMIMIRHNPRNLEMTMMETVVDMEVIGARDTDTDLHQNILQILMMRIVTVMGMVMDTSSLKAQEEAVKGKGAHPNMDANINNKLMMNA